MNNFTIRKVTKGDIPDLFAIRIATWENERGAEELAGLGITHESVRAMLGASHQGWIAHENGRPVGFAMANRETGELWVISVLAEYEGRGIGRALMEQAEGWLFAEGWKEIWLSTYLEEHWRAVGFYRHLGWVDWKTDGDRYLKKARP